MSLKEKKGNHHSSIPFLPYFGPGRYWVLKKAPAIAETGAFGW